MTAPAKDTLRAYIERVTAIRAERDSKVGPEELREIARDLGITAPELEAIERAAAAHLKRAHGFMANGFWDDAIAELTDALALGPSDGMLHLELAKAHFGRFETARSPNDRRIAEAEARRAVAIDAELEEGYRLLKRIANANQARPARKPTLPGPAAKKNRVGWWLFGLFVLAIGNKGPSPKVHPVGRVSQEAPAEAGSIEVRTADRSPWFKMATRVSEVRNNFGRSSYRFEGLAINQGRNEVTDMAVRLQLLDDNNHVVHEELLPAVGPWRTTPMRPGDERAIVLDRGIDATVTRAVFTPIAQKVRKAPRYKPSRLVAPVWDTPRPTGVRLEVRERRLSLGHLENADYLTLTLESKNGGVGALHCLSYTCEMYDAQGHLLASPHHDIVSSTEPALMPNETRTSVEMDTIPPNFHHYKLKIYYAS